MGHCSTHGWSQARHCSFISLMSGTQLSPSGCWKCHLVAVPAPCPCVQACADAHGTLARELLMGVPGKLTCLRESKAFVNLCQFRGSLLSWVA